MVYLVIPPVDNAYSLYNSSTKENTIACHHLLALCISYTGELADQTSLNPSSKIPWTWLKQRKRSHRDHSVGRLLQRKPYIAETTLERESTGLKQWVLWPRVQNLVEIKNQDPLQLLETSLWGIQAGVKGRLG
jgi:hypothetical protein